VSSGYIPKAETGTQGGGGSIRRFSEEPAEMLASRSPGGGAISWRTGGTSVGRQPAHRADRGAGVDVRRMVVRPTEQVHRRREMGVEGACGSCRLAAGSLAAYGIWLQEGCPMSGDVGVWRAASAGLVGVLQEPCGLPAVLGLRVTAYLAWASWAATLCGLAGKKVIYENSLGCLVGWAGKI
jgi:hypothetical protein